MKYSFFDLAFEGTSTVDLLKINNLKNQNIIVFEKQNEYGSTYSDASRLAENLHVSNLQIFKNNSKILFELDMGFLTSKDELVDVINKSGISEFLNFVSVKKRYYVDNDHIHLIPQTIGELIDCDWLNTIEKYYISKYVKNEVSIELVEHNLESKTREKFIFSLKDLKEELFYPVYGYKDISEFLSRSLAINNVAFILDKNISIESNNNVNDYKIFDMENNFLDFKFKINFNSDVIYCKNLCTKKLTFSKKHVRIFNIKNNVFNEMSVGHINYNSCIIDFFVVNSNSKCCDEGTYILYIISNHMAIDDNILKMLKCKDDEVLFNISYEIYTSEHVFV